MVEDLNNLIRYVNMNGYNISRDAVIGEFSFSYLKEYFDSGLNHKEIWILIDNRYGDIRDYYQELDLRLISMSKLSEILKVRSLDSFRLLDRVYQSLDYQHRLKIFNDLELNDIVEDSLTYLNIKFKNILNEDIKNKYDLITKLYVLQVYKNIIKNDSLFRNMRDVITVNNLIKRCNDNLYLLDFSEIVIYDMLGIKGYDDLVKYIEINKEIMYKSLEQKIDKKVHDLYDNYQNKLSLIIRNLNI